MFITMIAPPAAMAFTTANPRAIYHLLPATYHSLTPRNDAFRRQQ